MKLEELWMLYEADKRIMGFSPHTLKFFVVRVSADKPIAIFKYKSNMQITKNVENCKSKLRINNKIEKSHEPMTYSMRYFDSEKGYPDNYKEEQRYIDKYVRNINAPIKYSEL
ncbi:hypothetical protein [Paenibacillus sedimenti]|uniref:Uncharacterized protein n=1 Tax=Paenibacillus sedimenti TaxID=2770274 RepID=A0A926QMD3_9BACL|nr:hypothetical protein [Paenibacillus sedimenti]MBD0384851.1 hypothetical protein [Paenibacillus sedimenti]